MTRVSAAFEAAYRGEGRGLLVGYLPAGFPSYDGCVDAIRAMVDAGVDIVEIGLPYSDPVLDGPVIQRATERALAGGVRTRDVLRTVEQVASAGAAVLVMTYWNPIDRYGVDAFARDLKAAGGAGLRHGLTHRQRQARRIDVAKRHQRMALGMRFGDGAAEHLVARTGADNGVSQAGTVSKKGRRWPAASK